jgi:hypothetical protein
VKVRQARGLLRFVIQELGCCVGSKFEKQRCAFGSLYLDCEGALAGGFYVWVVFFSGEGTSFFWVGRLCLGMENRSFIEAKSDMEWRFFVEAKKFFFLVREDKAEFCLEERFCWVCVLGVQCSVWLVDIVEEVLKSSGIEDFAKCYSEVEKVLMVREGRNKAGCYMEVAVFAKVGWKGIIWLPEGRVGWGWRRFAGELRQLLASF